MVIDLNEIKHIRKKLGLTQKELASRADVSQSLIAKIEAGLLDPSYSKARKIIETLNDINKQKEMCVEKVMEKKIFSVKPENNIKEAIKLMKKHEISQMPVFQNNKPVGIVSESTLLDAILEEKHDVQIQDIMSEVPPILPVGSSLTVASDLLKFYPFVLISEKGKIVGLITKSDIIRKVYR